MTIRAAKPDDRLQVAQVHVRSWQVGYRGLLASDYLEQIDVAERAARYTFDDLEPSSPHTFVYEGEDKLLGFITVSVGSQGEGGEGEVMALYVDPDFWSSGVGRELMKFALGWLDEQGATVARLWVLEGNERGIHFYVSGGWAFDDLTREDEVWGTTVSERRMSRRVVS